MPLVSRLECQIPRSGEHHILTQLCSQPSLEYVAVLVLAGVAVQRGSEMTRRDGMLDEREATT